MKEALNKHGCKNKHGCNFQIKGIYEDSHTVRACIDFDNRIEAGRNVLERLQAAQARDGATATDSAYGSEEMQDDLAIIGWGNYSTMDDFMAAPTSDVEPFLAYAATGGARANATIAEAGQAGETQVELTTEQLAALSVHSTDFAHGTDL